MQVDAVELRGDMLDHVSLSVVEKAMQYIPLWGFLALELIYRQQFHISSLKASCKSTLEANDHRTPTKTRVKCATCKVRVSARFRTADKAKP